MSNLKNEHNVNTTTEAISNHTLIETIKHKNGDEKGLFMVRCNTPLSSEPPVA